MLGSVWEKGKYLQCADSFLFSCEDEWPQQRTLREDLRWLTQVGVNVEICRQIHSFWKIVGNYEDLAWKNPQHCLVYTLPQCKLPSTKPFVISVHANVPQNPSVLKFCTVLAAQIFLICSLNLSLLFLLLLSMDKQFINSFSCLSVLYIEIYNQNHWRVLQRIFYTNTSSHLLKCFNRPMIMWHLAGSPVVLSVFL